MRPRLTILALLALMIAIPAQGIIWEADLEAATKNASRTGRPIMLLLTVGTDPHDEKLADGLLRNDAIVWESRGFHCVVGCEGSHLSAAIETFLGTEPACARFPGMTCAAHRRVAKLARRQGLAGDQERQQVLFLKPDGKAELGRVLGPLSADQLHIEMRAAIRKLLGVEPAEAPGLAVKQLFSLASSRNAPTRRKAFAELTTVDHADVARGIERLLRGSSRQQIQLEVAMAMGESRQVRFAPCVARLLRSSNSTTRIHASIALEKIRSPLSAGAIKKALARERKSRVRANLVRALAACAKDPKVVRSAVLKLLSGRTDDERTAALFVASRLPLDPKLRAALVRIVRTADRRMRPIAYAAAGAHRLAECQRILERRAPSERNLAKARGAWALRRIARKERKDLDLVLASIEKTLPDNHVREGRLSPNPANRWDFRRR